jgi:hypothetical protein
VGIRFCIAGPPVFTTFQFGKSEMRRNERGVLPKPVAFAFRSSREVCQSFTPLKIEN